MRYLTVNELAMVNGAGFAEDMAVTAATFYVASCVYKAGELLGAAVMSRGAVFTTNAVIASTWGSALFGVGSMLAVGGYFLNANPQLASGLGNKLNEYFKFY